MKYFYGLFIGSLTLVALAWIIHLSLNGKPISKIKLSEFTSPHHIAESLSMRLRQEIKDHSILFLGLDIDQPEHIQIWIEFLKLIKEPGWKFDEIIVEEGLNLPALGLGEVVLNVKANEDLLKVKWLSEINLNKRIVVIVPDIYSSQLLKDNPIQRLKSSVNEGIFLSLTLVGLGASAEDPIIQKLPCSADGADITGQSALGCVVRKKAMFHTKPLKTNVRLGVVEQVGLHDFLVFYRPMLSKIKN